MNSLLITYELENHVDYPLISNKIKSYNHWAKPMNGVWIIKSDKKAGEVRSELAEAVGNRAKILVVNILNISGWGTYRVSKEVTSWMKEKI